MDVIDDLRMTHLAMSVPRALLQGDSRRRLADFFATCFGFREQPVDELPEDGALVLVGGPAELAWEDHGNVFLSFIAADRPMVGSGTGYDHVGLSVPTLEQYRSLRARVEAYAGRYGDVEVTMAMERPVALGTLHVFVVAFVALPVPVGLDVQYFERAG